LADRDLKRLELEIVIPEMLLDSAGDAMDAIKRIRVMSALMYDRHHSLVIADVDWKEEEDLVAGLKIEYVEHVQRIGSGSESTMYLVQGNFPPIFTQFLTDGILDLNCFIDFPITLISNKARFAIVGTRENVTTIPSILEGLSVEFKITSFRNYQLTGPGLLATLTELQLKCLKLAVENGYYDIPKDTGVRKLAERMGISHTTLSLHLRKAESKIIKGLFE